MTIVTAGPYPINMFPFIIWDDGERYYTLTTTEATPSLYTLALPHSSVTFFGAGFIYGSDGRPTGGVITGFEATETATGLKSNSYQGLSLPAAELSDALAHDTGAIMPDILSGDDSVTGSPLNDDLRGAAGNDTLMGGDGDDFLDGGTKQAFWLPYDPVGDPLHDGANYLRGGQGSDIISGGALFDDINGNQGNDTAHGGGGDDWVVGGKDQDVLYGDDGGDIIYGNLGDDTCDGGPGSDIMRGGQGDDSLSGGSGDDWLSGDLGSDTVSGGAGADIFHSFGEAGVDRVTDFGEGDRVMLDSGSAYTVAQVGADTVITLGGDAQMILVGVQLSTLGGDWIFMG